MGKLFATVLLTTSVLLSNAVNASPLYDLSFANTEHSETSLSEYRGKVILLNFWATWCPPCVKEMPSMERLRQHFKGQPFEVVAINAGEQRAAVDAFLLEMEDRGTPLTFPILLDEKGRSFREFGLRGLPMSFIFDQDGKRIETISGEVEWDDEVQIEKITELLKR